MDGEARDPGYVDLGFARVDTDRLPRTGDPEVVYAAGKTPDEVIAVVGTLCAAAPHRPALVTRADPATVAAIRLRWPDAQVEATTWSSRTCRRPGVWLRSSRRGRRTHRWRRTAVKLVWGTDGAVVDAMPEWKDVARAAAALDRPVKRVLAQAVGLAETSVTDARRPPGRE